MKKREVGNESEKDFKDTLPW